MKAGGGQNKGRRDETKKARQMKTKKRRKANRKNKHTITKATIRKQTNIKKK